MDRYQRRHQKRRYGRWDIDFKASYWLPAIHWRDLFRTRNVRESSSHIVVFPNGCMLGWGLDEVLHEPERDPLPRWLVGLAGTLARRAQSLVRIPGLVLKPDFGA